MSGRDVVRATFDEFVRSSGLSRRSKSWYRRTDETIVVLTLTRSPWGRQYFLAVGVVLRALDADENPKDKDAPIRSRLDRLVPSELEHRVNDLLDLEFAIADSARRIELLGLLRAELEPLMEACLTVDGLRSGAGRSLVRNSTVNDSARELLRYAAPA